MKHPSFKLRFILITTLSTGLLFAAFSFWSWRTVSTHLISRIDHEIMNIGHRHLSVMQAREHWPHVMEALHFVYGEEETVWLAILDPNGSAIYKSPLWPEDLPLNNYPRPNGLAPQQNMDTDLSQRPPPPNSPFTDITPPDGRDDAFENRPPPRDGSHQGRPPMPPHLRGGPPMKLSVTAPSFDTVIRPEGRWRIGVLGNEMVTLVLGLPLSNVDAQMRPIAFAYFVAFLLTLGLLAGLGWFTTNRMLQPVQELTRAAKGLSVQDLSQRIELPKAEAEFKELAGVINSMLDRLEGSFDQARRFSADAAHELKTPLMVFQGELERSIQDAEPGSDQQQSYSRLLEEVQHLKTIIQKLLLLSQADSGRLNIHAVTFDLSDEVEAITEDFQLMAPHLKITAEIEPGIQLVADKGLLIQLLHNLVSNAVKYNNENKRIRMQLKKKDNLVRFRIANSGSPIPIEHQDKIFDRFFKGESSRFRRGESSGLGLSLCYEITRAHGGDLQLVQSNDRYTVFEVILPC